MRGTLLARTLADVDVLNPVNREHPLNAGLVSWWSGVPALAGGVVWPDLTGFAPVTLGTSWARWVATPYGMSPDGNGSTWRGETAGRKASPAFTRNTFIIEMGFRVESLPTTRYLFSKRGTTRQHQLWVNSSGTVTFETHHAAVNSLTTTATVTAGTWAHVVATFDGSTKQLWLNGANRVSVGSLAASATNTDAEILIGHRGSNFAPYIGQISDVRYSGGVFCDSAGARARYESWLAGHPETLRRTRPWSFGVSAGGGITGSASATLAGATGSASGQLAIAGSSSTTLAAVAGAGAGQLALTGAGAGTLDGATGAATGSSQTTGSSSVTLADVTGSASGQLALSGSSSVTLAAVAGTGAGQLALAGVSNATLDALLGSAVAALALSGAAGGALDGATGAATGSSQTTGSSSATLAGAAGTGAGQLAIAGVSNAALDALLGAAVGLLALSGAGSGALDGATGSGAGSAGSNTGSSTATLAGATGSGAGQLALSGSSSATLAGASGSAAGGVSNTGAASATLAGATGSAVGRLAITGAASGSLAGATGSASGGATVIPQYPLKLRRGPVGSAPTLASGEVATTTDQQRLLLGTSGGNVVLSVRMNISATSDPTSGDDLADGWSPGSMWINTSTPQAFICLSAAAGAAVWQAL